MYMYVTVSVCVRMFMHMGVRVCASMRASVHACMTSKQKHCFHSMSILLFSLLNLVHRIISVTEQFGSFNLALGYWNMAKRKTSLCGKLSYVCLCVNEQLFQC